jgi:hypothetical protein
VKTDLTVEERGEELVVRAPRGSWIATHQRATCASEKIVHLARIPVVPCRAPHALGDICEKTRICNWQLPTRYLAAHSTEQLVEQPRPIRGGGSACQLSN